MTAKPDEDAILPLSSRPIRLFSLFSELSELIVAIKMSPFRQGNDIIPTPRLGFPENHGTIEQLNSITNEIRKGNITLRLFLLSFKHFIKCVVMVSFIKLNNYHLTLSTICLYPTHPTDDTL